MGTRIFRSVNEWITLRMNLTELGPIAGLVLGSAALVLKANSRTYKGNPYAHARIFTSSLMWNTVLERDLGQRGHQAGDCSLRMQEHRDQGQHPPRGRRRK